MASDWSIQIPLFELVALHALPAQMEVLQRENAQLRKELDGLHRLYSELLQVVADYRREMRKR